MCPSRRRPRRRPCAPRAPSTSATSRRSASSWREPMSDLVVHPTASPAADGTLIDVTPASAGRTYVGFEVPTLAPGVVAKRDTRDREVCIVVISGTVTVNSEHGEYNELGGRPDPW